MNVAFLTHYTSLYGANRSLLDLIDGLRSYDMVPFVLSPSRGAITSAMSDRGIETSIYPYKGWLGRSRLRAPARLVANLVLLPFVVRQLKEWKIDLIHTNSSVIPIGAFAAAVLGVPHVWHVREFAWEHYRLRRDWGDRFFYHWLGRAESVICVSNALRENVDQGQQITARVIYNGVLSCTEMAELERTYSNCSPAEQYTFSIIGRISPRKGQDVAIRAVEELVNQGLGIRLLIAGSGDESYVRKLKRHVQEAGLGDAVHFLGYVDDPFEVYFSSHAVLVCSEHEAMGRVTAEAMAAGRPIVGRKSGGTAELVSDGETGLLYDGTTADVIQAMKKLILNRPCGIRMGEKGRDVACEHFSLEKYAQQVHTTYRQAVHGTASKVGLS